MTLMALAKLAFFAGGLSLLIAAAYGAPMLGNIPSYERRTRVRVSVFFLLMGLLNFYVASMVAMASTYAAP